MACSIDKPAKHFKRVWSGSSMVETRVGIEPTSARFAVGTASRI